MGTFFVIEIIVPGQINLFYLVMQSFIPYNKTVATNTIIEEEKMTENRYQKIGQHCVVKEHTKATVLGNF